MYISLCKMCRDEWKALLSEQGFESVLTLGEPNMAPALLQRQVVAAGLSNGEVYVRAPAMQPGQLRATMQPLTSELLRGFACIPLCDNLTPGKPATPAHLPLPLTPM